MIGDLRVDLTGWEGPLSDLEGELAAAVDRAVEEAMAEGADRVRTSTLYQQRTGAYAASVRSGIEGSFAGGNLTGFVMATAPHAEFLEHGTRPHVIKPKKGSGGRLRFQASGTWVFARLVHHPGTKPLRLVETCITKEEVELRLNDAAAAKIR